MIKVNYKSETGQILGFYPDEIEYQLIPEPYIEITEEQHKDCLNNQGYRKIDLKTKKVITCTPIIPEKTKKELMDELTAKYQETIENLSKAMIVATLKNSTTQIESLKKTYNELTLKYKQERDVITNG